MFDGQRRVIKHGNSEGTLRNDASDLEERHGFRQTNDLTFAQVSSHTYRKRRVKDACKGGHITRYSKSVYILNTPENPLSMNQSTRR